MNVNVAKEPPFALVNIPKMSEFIWSKLLSEKQTIKKQLQVGQGGGGCWRMAYLELVASSPPGSQGPHTGRGSRGSDSVKFTAGS